ncbi:MAG: CPBP family intramembrane glutamic endopeptidase [Leifsonia sp.]
MTSSIENRSSWKRFWERGDWWRAIILAAGYYVLYQLASLLLVPWASSFDDPDSGGYVLFFYALPILFGGVILVVFAWSVGWLKELFARQPIRGNWWMWIAVAVVVVFNVLHFATIDYASVDAGYVAAWILAGLCIGFAEETLTRGFVVNMMRKAGRPEIAVATVSAAIFAALHSGNLIMGQTLFATLIQVAYTFAFGICMYLALRVTGNLIWPILLHATTDPSIFMQAAHPADGALTAFAGLGNIVVIIVGLVLMIFIRGRVQTRDSALTSPAVVG